MKVDQLDLLEMAKPAQKCAKCGLGPMSKTHFWRNGGWQCKKGNTAAATVNKEESSKPTHPPAPPHHITDAAVRRGLEDLYDKQKKKGADKDSE